MKPDVFKNLLLYSPLIAAAGIPFGKILADVCETKCAEYYDEKLVLEEGGVLITSVWTKCRSEVEVCTPDPDPPDSTPGPGPAPAAPPSPPPPPPDEPPPDCSKCQGFCKDVNRIFNDLCRGHAASKAQAQCHNGIWPDGRNTGVSDKPGEVRTGDRICVRYRLEGSWKKRVVCAEEIQTFHATRTHWEPDITTYQCVNDYLYGTRGASVGLQFDFKGAGGGSYEVSSDPKKRRPGDVRRASRCSHKWVSCRPLS